MDTCRHFCILLMMICSPRVELETSPLSATSAQSRSTPMQGRLITRSCILERHWNVMSVTDSFSPKLNCKGMLVDFTGRVYSAVTSVTKRSPGFEACKDTKNNVIRTVFSGSFLLCIWVCHISLLFFIIFFFYYQSWWYFLIRVVPDALDSGFVSPEAFVSICHLDFGYLHLYMSCHWGGGSSNYSFPNKLAALFVVSTSAVSYVYSQSSNLSEPSLWHKKFHAKIAVIPFICFFTLNIMLSSSGR